LDRARRNGLRVWTIILIIIVIIIYTYSPSKSARLAFGYIIISLPDLLTALETVCSSLVPATSPETQVQAPSKLEYCTYIYYMHKKIISVEVADPNGLWQVSSSPLFCSNVSQSANSISLYLRLWPVCPLQGASQPVFR